MMELQVCWNNMKNMNIILVDSLHSPPAQWYDGEHERILASGYPKALQKKGGVYSGDTGIP